MIEAAVALAGVLVGVFVTPFLSHRFARRSEKLVQKRTAYLDFLSAVSRLARPDLHKDANTDLLNANMRILLYGNNEVIAKTQAFMAYDRIVKPGAKEAFSEVVLAMRSDVGESVILDQNGIILSIVFGNSE